MSTFLELKDFPPWATAFLETLLTALRERDPYTYGHCRRVARLSRLLAESAGLPTIQAQSIEISSLLHDLGKLSIPDAILLKEGRLTAKEQAIMKLHPVKSVEILEPLARSLPRLLESLPGIRHHHERVDGRGYPDRISGEKIPLNARVILIADTFDAMTTTRPYRKGLPDQTAYKELKVFSGRQFDPDLVKIFIKAHPTWSDHQEEITEEFISKRFRRAA